MNRDEAIRARCEAATPGPWKLTKDGRYEDHDECRIDLPDDNIELCRYENGEFIAHARNYIPDLLDEVERLRAENCHLMGMTLTEYMDLRKIIGENAEYKADIEAGRLIRVPCREFFGGAGGTVWLLWGGEAIEMVHCGADIGAEGKPFAALVCEDKIFPYRTPIAEYDLDPTDWCTNVKYV